MSRYQAEDIQVLTGLEPVRKRPGMYTDTSTPDHLAQEVLDNSVDEALGNHARHIDVRLHPDGSLTVEDDGRGMPVDIHPEHKCSGVELILCTLHAGAKFGEGGYELAGGLHGVGVSVVNALSSMLEVTVHRDGGVWWMKFKNGEPVAPLERTARCGKRNTGTRLRFWPNPEYFENLNFSQERLCALLRAKAVLCPGLEMNLYEEQEDGTMERKGQWCYEDGLGDYLGSLLEESRPAGAGAAAGDARAAGRWQGAPGLGDAMAAGGRQTGLGDLCQPGADPARRHPRQWLSQRRAGGGARVL